MRKYKVKRPFSIFKRLFLEGDEIWVEDSKYVMNGVIDYGREVFSDNREYLGMLSNSHFNEHVKNKLEE